MRRAGRTLRPEPIYQHEARGADKAITDAIEKHVDDEQRQDDDGDDGPAGVPVPALWPVCGPAEIGLAQRLTSACRARRSYCL